MVIPMEPNARNTTTEHPNARPIARCRPERVNGMPILRDNFPFAEDAPMALFQEKDTPYFRRRAKIPPLLTNCPHPFKFLFSLFRHH